MIKLNHLQLRVPPDFRGREPDLVNAVASALADIRLGHSVSLDRLGPIRVAASKGQSIADTGRLIASGIVARLPPKSTGGGND